MGEGAPRGTSGFYSVNSVHCHDNAELEYNVGLKAKLQNFLSIGK